jgi:dUTPase
MVEVKIKKLRPDAKLPEFANDYAVGVDLFILTYKNLASMIRGYSKLE